ALRRRSCGRVCHRPSQLPSRVEGRVLQERIAALVGTRCDLSDRARHAIARASAQALVEEAQSNADRWRLTNYAGRLANRPLLMVTSDDGFARGSDALADAIQDWVLPSSSASISRPITVTRIVGLNFKQPFCCG
ncbi:hypothetical protein, partial [uncultured Sphingomonas sp.]|uniref:hypothetical protein n=1 Tax=uncultured Sphingomonas sp. TaxID=158754 RepID=UPI0035CC07E0